MIFKWSNSGRTVYGLGLVKPQTNHEEFSRTLPCFSLLFVLLHLIYIREGKS